MSTITIPELPNSSDLDINDYLIIYNTEANPDVLTYKGRIGDVLHLLNIIVNGKTGTTITITPDDLHDSTTLNKFVTASDKTKIALVRTDQGSGTFLAGDGTYRTVGTSLGNSNYTVNTISDRDLLSGLNNGDRVLVIDASSDPVVTRGAALYFWKASTGQFVLIADSIELNFTISGLTTQFHVYTGTTAPATYALKGKFNTYTGTTNSRITAIENGHLTGVTYGGTYAIPFVNAGQSGFDYYNDFTYSPTTNMFVAGFGSIVNPVPNNGGVFGNTNIVGATGITGTNYSGWNSLTYGSFNNNYSISSLVGGDGAQALFTDGIGGDVAIALNGNPTISGDVVDNPNYTFITAKNGAVNISHNSTGQTHGHGAFAPSSVILGGQDHNIPSGSTNSVIIGGNHIKAATGVTNTVYLPKVRIGQGIGSSIPTGSTSTNILVLDSTTGEVKIGSGSNIGITTANNGLTKSGSNVHLGGTLTGGSTTITSNSNNSLNFNVVNDGFLDVGVIKFNVNGNGVVGFTTSAPVLNYLADRSSQYTTRSVPDKGYVDGHLNGLTFSNSYSTGSLLQMNGTNWTYCSVPFLVSGQTNTVKVKLVTGNTTVTIYDQLILVDTSSNTITVTMPSTTPLDGKFYTIKDMSANASANNITINGNGKTIDGSSTQTISTNNGKMTLTFSIVQNKFYITA